MKRGCREHLYHKFVTDDEIRAFMDRFDHILIHLDIDVLDAALFHSTYFVNKDLVGDGSGRMTIEKRTAILKNITNNSDVVGLTIAEYLPFDEHRLHDMFSDIRLFTDQFAVDWRMKKLVEVLWAQKRDHFSLVVLQKQ